MAVSLAIRSLFVLGLFWSQAEADFFIQHPVDLTVQVGGEALFWCATEKGIPCQNMHWVYSNSLNVGDPIVTIGTCSEPTLQTAPSNLKRFSITWSESRYDIRISNITQADSGRYGCRAQEANGQSNIHVFSQFGVLTVITPVPAPLCRTRAETVNINGNVSFFCQVPPNAEESVSLTWYFEPIRYRRGVNDVAPGRSFTEKYRLRESDNYGRFICIAGPNSHNGPNCTLVPLQIPTNATIRVNSSHTVSNADSTTTATFDCDADAVPPVTSYQWRLVRYDPATNKWKDVVMDDRYNVLNGGRTLTVSLTGMGRTRIAVSCTASNILDLSATSKLAIRCEDGTWVTALPQCDYMPTQAAQTKPSDITLLVTNNANSGGNKQEGVDAGIIVAIVISILVLLIIIALLLCFLIIRSRRSKKTNNNSERLQAAPGVAYNTYMYEDTVDIGRQTSSFRANALMSEAENGMANARAPAADTVNNRRGPDHDDADLSSDERHEDSSRHLEGINEGQAYASIGDDHRDSGFHRFDVSRHDGDVYASVGEEKASENSKPQIKYLDNPQDKLSGYESVEPKSRPCAYESIDLTTSSVAASKEMGKTSDAGQKPAKNVCVVSPTIHVEREGSQVLYAMPDKTNKKNPKQDNTDSKNISVPHKFVKPAGKRSDVLYALPDKTSQRSAKISNQELNSSDEKLSLPPTSRNSTPEVVYAMPDKSRGKAEINRSLSSDAVMEGDKSDISTGKRSVQSHSKSRTLKPRKPERTPSSRLAGSRVLGSKNETTGRLQRSSSADILGKEDDVSALYAKPDKQATTTSNETSRGTGASPTPVYARPDKGEKLPDQNKTEREGNSSGKTEPIYADAN